MPAPPTDSEAPGPRRRAVVIYILLAAHAVALCIAGGLHAEAAWGAVCLAAGLLCGAIIGVAAVLRSWISAVYGVAMVTAAGLIAAGVVTEAAGLIGTGVLALTIVAACAPISLLLREGLRHGPAAAGEGTQLRVLRQIHENSMLSDNAKRVLFRERELGLLREVIETDIVHGKYNAALTLCDEMAQVFGYLEEAEMFRGRIDQARQEHYEAEVTAALANLDALLAARNWAAVHREAARIRRLYGDSHLVQDLDQRILSARDEHKAELENEFLEAARADDVTRAMGLLKKLDRYLAADEAVRLKEVAEGVVVRRRQNLGARFKLAVNDRRWAEAAEVGQLIMEEFPNTKMAGEVRSMIEVLRTRATQAALGQ